MARIDPLVIQRFEKDQIPLLKSRVNVIFLMAAGMVPIFGLADYLLFPDHFNSFMASRFIVAVFCLLFYWINTHRELGQRSMYLGIAACYMVALAIIKMIVDLGGYTTSYYAGLNLIFIGLCVFIPVRFWYVIFHSTMIYLLYLLMVFLFNEIENPGLFFTNNMFVLATLAIMVVGSHINYHLRLREYLLRIDLDRLRQQLEKYSQGLEIKVKKKDEDLIQKVRELRNRQARLIDTQKASIFGLAKLTESRDKGTGEHLFRIQVYCNLIAQECSKQDRHREVLTEAFITDLTDSCVLHDVGKVAIPDEVLLKPGRLSDQEYETIKSHTVLGRNVLEAIEQRLGDEAFLSLGRDIAYSHHEHYDGTGYPQGLKGEAIPLAARIVAVADAYDAITSNRCYRHSLPHQEAVRRIIQASATQFDPFVVDAFLQVQEQICQAGELIHAQNDQVELSLGNGVSSVGDQPEKQPDGSIDRHGFREAPFVQETSSPLQTATVIRPSLGRAVQNRVTRPGHTFVTPARPWNKR